jgi:pyrroloquinoline-quinone synthase|tara:strand:- start:1251 stop:2051 length:801 start_codon:yes stop_codon:yes gene_type:complete
MTLALRHSPAVVPTRWYGVSVPDEPLMSPEAFSDAMQQIGRERYHNLHPFHGLLHGGKLNFGQVQAWALNRYYYQASIPRKDLTLMARLKSPDMRNNWRSRVLDHDGHEVEDGGISRYLQLIDALDLDRDYVISTEGLLPATRFAVDAYVHFVAERSELEMIASSLTELFAPAIHRERIAGLSEHYDWADERALAYFKKRLNEAPKDAEYGCDYVIRNARTREHQEAVLNALRFKTDVLWAQLDALYAAYVEPGLIPPGAFVPDDG